MNISSFALHKKYFFSHKPMFYFLNGLKNFQIESENFFFRYKISRFTGP